MQAGLGCMRLSTEADRDEEGGIAVLHAALDAGVTLLDTADCYGVDEWDVGHNERLIARALASWGGDRSRVTVATKGGLRRPGGRWEPDGRARHLRAACEASRRALGVERIDLYQLHAPDPRTPLATSVRALATLRDEGLIGAIGLCNVNVGQIEAAARIAEIAAVQVELGPFALDGLRGGVLAHCAGRGIRLLAHRPLGGPDGRRRIERDPVLRAVGERHGATPFEVALAWLRGLGDHVVPIPGATRPETARSAAAAQRLRLGRADRDELDAHLGATWLRAPARHRPPPRADGEVVLVMGYPAAGKTTAADDLVGAGYRRLNRDLAGGRLADLLPELERGLAAGERRFVLDNTFPTRKSRNRVLEVASRHRVPVRCVWLDTSLEDAQVNAVRRMIARHGRLLGPEEIAEVGRRDPAVFDPRAQFRYRRALEPPAGDEGFARVEVVPFERRRDPGRDGRAVFVDHEGVLWATPAHDPGDVALLPDRAAALRRYAADGHRLLALSWQPGLGDGSTSPERLARCFARTQELLGVEIETAICPHGPGPPVCWCRKPLPGLAVAFVEQHGLDPERCILVGRSAADRGLARRMGFRFVEPQELAPSG